MRARLTAFLLNDPYVIKVLDAVKVCGPAQAYVAAGFVRNRVWDSFYDKKQNEPDVDIDIVYYDRRNPDKKHERFFEEKLEQCLPTGIWQVRNQARMHTFGGYPPFNSLEHALTHWAETATTVGGRLKHNGELDIIAPFGLDDLFSHTLRITPQMKKHDPAGFDERLLRKKWLARWPDLKVIRG